MLLLGPINQNWSFFPLYLALNFFFISHDRFFWPLFFALVTVHPSVFPHVCFLTHREFCFLPWCTETVTPSSFTGLPDCQHDPRNYHFEEKVTTRLCVLYMDVIFQVTSADWAPFFSHSGWKAALAHQPFPEFFLSESWVMMTFLRQLSRPVAFPVASSGARQLLLPLDLQCLANLWKQLTWNLLCSMITSSHMRLYMWTYIF